MEFMVHRGNGGSWKKASFLAMGRLDKNDEVLEDLQCIGAAWSKERVAQSKLKMFTYIVYRNPVPTWM